MSSSRFKPSVTVGRCAFCDGSPLTAEHLWPKWASSHFRRTAHDSRIEATAEVPLKSKAPPVYVRRERHGHTTTKKLRVACRRCNGTWMSALETAAKPYLEPMILGERTIIPANAQQDIARWIALKMMVADLSRETFSAILRSQREEFRKSLTIPGFMRIWIFNYRGLDWQSSMRQDSFLMGTSPEAPPDFPLPKNTKTFTMGFGHILIFVLFTQILDFEDYATIDWQGGVLRVWPERDRLVVWPMGLPLNDQGAHFISDTLGRFTASPKVIAMDV